MDHDDPAAIAAHDQELAQVKQDVVSELGEGVKIYCAHQRECHHATMEMASYILRDLTASFGQPPEEMHPVMIIAATAMALLTDAALSGRIPEDLMF